MEKARKSIVVLMLDTVRRSALEEPGMGNIQSIARKGTTYANAVSPGTWTAPSHAALFSDRMVSMISNVSRDFFKTDRIDPWMVRTKFLEDRANTMAAKLSKLGYNSTLFSNNPFLTSSTNLGVGFDRVYDVWLDSNLKYNRGMADRFMPIVNGGARARKLMFWTSYFITRMLPGTYLDRLYLSLRQRLNDGVSEADGTYRLDKGAKDTNAILKSFLECKYDYRPQFIFINYMEAHENYPASKEAAIPDKWLYLGGIKELDDRTCRELYRAYKRRLHYLDRMVGEAVGMLKKSPIMENASLVITSDHGQFFGEHGLLYHSLPPYEEVSGVPLILANYENGRQVGERASRDAPVSLNALHKSIISMAEGRSDHLNGNLRDSRYVFSEHMGISEGWDEGLLRLLKSRSKSARAIYEAKNRYNRRVTAAYRGSMKLVHRFGRGGDELYDISKDPEESDNIIGNNRDIALELARSIGSA